MTFRQAKAYLQSDPGKYCIVVNYVVLEAIKIKFKPNQENIHRQFSMLPRTSCFDESWVL